MQTLNAPTVSSNDRLCELATLLAQGVRRHRQVLRRCESRDSGEPAESPAQGLEVRRTSRLSVSRAPG